MDTNSRCPVCGAVLDFEPYEGDLPSFEICPCCGTQFGYDDATRRHSDLRQQWIDNGKRWWLTSDAPPPGWDPDAQLAFVQKDP